MRKLILVCLAVVCGLPLLVVGGIFVARAIGLEPTAFTVRFGDRKVYEYSNIPKTTVVRLSDVSMVNLIENIKGESTLIVGPKGGEGAYLVMSRSGRLFHLEVDADSAELTSFRTLLAGYQFHEEHREDLFGQNRVKVLIVDHDFQASALADLVIKALKAIGVADNGFVEYLY